MLRALFDADGIEDNSPAPPLVRDCYLDGIEVMIARDHGVALERFVGA